MGFIVWGAVTCAGISFRVFTNFNRVGWLACGRYSSIFGAISLCSKSEKDKPVHFNWEWAQGSREKRMFGFWRF